MTHLGSWSYDVATGIFSLSDEYYRITGYEPGAYAPTWENIRACVHPDDQAKIDSGLKLGSGEWRHDPIVVMISRPDGTIRFVLSCAEVLPGPGGAAGFVRGTIQDITEQYEAERLLEKAYDETLEGWARALDLHDHETEGHSRRVTELSDLLATKIGLSREEIAHIRRGALLHDIGKVGIPDSILLKPARLTDSERAEMQKHPTFGLEVLSPIEFLKPALDIPYYHHERWDGTGYPQGKRGNEIPLAARLFALADVWDALTSSILKLSLDISSILNSSLCFLK
jgi:putative nucleotidyltransferase with HDIG domain